LRNEKKEKEMVNDLVSDMLTRIRNASLAKHSRTSVRYSKLNLAILKVLVAEGYIENYEILKFLSLENELMGLKNLDHKERANFVCNFLDNLTLTEGFIFNNYCLAGTINQEFQRQYFSDENGKKIDTIRKQIQEWQENSKITSGEYYFLLATLLENADKVANTASVYGAFLKQLKKSAQQKFLMKPASFVLSGNNHIVYNKNIETLIDQVEGDVLYLDPPYNQRQYASNYHLLETIAKYDNPTIAGKTGLRDYLNQKSKFSQKTAVLKAFASIIQQAKVKYIFLSYNNEGLLTMQEIENINTPMRMKSRHQTTLINWKYLKIRKNLSSQPMLGQ
jgi:adenine-specific DNA-methyltransferase